MPSELSILDKLKQWSTIVVDTSDITEIEKFAPHDATTNPSLLFQAVQSSKYADLVTKTIKQVKEEGKENQGEPSFIDEVIDSLSVAFGCEILKLIPGVVSTEIDAKFSFDVEKSVAKAKKIIGMYEQAGYSKNRILIKLATTWEGCQAAKVN